MKTWLLFLCILLGSSAHLLAQTKFDVEKLRTPAAYGPEVASSISTTEVPRYNPDSNNTLVFLPNGLNSSSYQAPSEWLDRKDSLIPYQVDIVFSKFPLVDDAYHMKYPLLCNRLLKLFAIDSALNSSQLTWRIVLQTDCEDEAQVRSLFHGVVLHCSNTAQPADTNSETNSKATDSLSAFARMSVTTSLVSLSEIPPEVQQEMEGKSEIERREILTSFYRRQMERSPEENDTTSLETYLEESKEMIESFLDYYSYGSTDNTVMEVLDRNDWSNALVVADWTGSMYRYGAHVLLWHSLHYRKSKVAYITLFNDGNMTFNPDKVVGNTGGIYHAEADKLKGIMDLYRYVMLRGAGGDLQENDLEAVLSAIKRFPHHGDVVLVADNRACVRDIALLDSINVPVHVILCGLRKNNAINPQYLQIAATTGGSIHTLNSDIKDLVLRKDGKVKLPDAFKDSLSISNAPCDRFASMYPEGYFDNKVFNDFKETKGNTKNVLNLSLSDQGYKWVPRRLKNFDHLKSIDLSYNEISRLNKAIFNLAELEILDLKGNQLTEISPYFATIKTLQRLDLSNNLIDSIAPSLLKCKKLTHLNLSENGLRSLPRNFYFNEMESIDLSNNDLSELTAVFFRMRELRILQLSGNEISSIPSQIGLLRRLRTLDLSDNRLEKLPKSLGRLKKLEHLDLTGNDLSYEEVERLREKLPNTTIVYQ